MDGSSWTSTLAYDLNALTYDAAGNLTALQRYRETGTLVDNLTYSYPGTSNRLSAVTDAVTGNVEPWDARTGGFTYDPNGNLLSAPAPYSLTTVSYNDQNLPVSLTRSGVTTTYRYDDGGERITKQVGAGNTEVYVRDGATTLGVFTVNGAGTPVSWYFNLVWEDRVVGRQPSSGNRSYYHVDVLGSTRAVVQGTMVVESYDFDPWGLLLPGRTLGSGTREGFGGKEQDAETGLDYFGARYYMPALGRWAAVDPLVDGTPQWSPYTYVFDDPVLHTDPDGRQVDVKETNAYWEGVAIAGHQRGGARGWLQAAFATAMSTVVEYGGLNAMDAGTDRIADGHVVSGIALTALGASSLLPGLGAADDAAKGAGAVDDVVRLATQTDDMARAAGREAIDATGDASARLGSDAAQGTIYRVDGSATPSGKPYIGRHNKPEPSKTRRSNDGRDRSKAEVIDKYDAKDVQQGRTKEQEHIERHGGIQNLDNKRNEIRRQ